MADEFERRTFTGDPEPPPTTKGMTDTFAPAPASAPPPPGEPPAPIPVDSAPAAPKSKGRYTVVDQMDGPLKMYYEPGDGQILDYGEITVPGAREKLKAAGGGYNEVTRTWSPPEEVALPLREGNPGWIEFTKKMYATGEAGIAEGLIGWEALSGKKNWDEAIAQGDIELLKTLKNEFPSELWRNTKPEALGASLKWALGATAKAVPSLTGGLLAGAEKVPVVAGGALALGAAAGPLAWGAIASPAGFAAIVSGSASAGMFDFTAKVTAGSIALDMKKKGISDATIKNVAPIAGMMAGALEMAHVKYLPAPARRLFVQKVLGNEMVKKAMSHWFSNYLIETGAEAGVEGAQQAVEEYSKRFMAVIEKRDDLVTSHENILKAVGMAFAEGAVAFAGLKTPGMIVDYAGSRPAKANVRALKTAIAAGEFDAKTASVAKIEGAVNPESDTTKLNEVLANPEKAEKFGKRNAQNEDAKAALHAKAEALKIKYVALTEGKPVTELSDEAQTEVLKIAEQMTTLNTIGEGMEVGGREEPMVPTKEPQTVPEIIERKHAEKRAVLTKLERESKAMEAERADIEVEIVKRIDEQKSTAALDAAASKLTQKITANDALAAEIYTTPALMDETLADRLAGSGVEGVMSATEIVAAERDAQDRITAARTSFFRHGAAYAKREVQRVQTYIQELVKRSGMDKADQSKFISVLRNTQTIEQLEKNYPEIRDRIFVAEEIKRAKASEQILAKALKAGKVKSVDGKPTGKFGDADTQAIVSAVNAVNKMTRSAAVLEVNAAETALTDAADESSPDYSPKKHAKAYYAYKAARFRAGEMSTAEGAAFVADLTGMMQGKRAEFLVQREEERAARIAEIEAGVTKMLGDVVPPPGYEKAKVESGSWVKGLKIPRGLVGLYEKGLGSIHSIGHLLAYRTGEKAGESWIEKELSAHKEETKFDGLKLHWHERLTETMEKAYNFTGSAWARAKAGRALHKRLLTPHDLGEHTNAKGQKVNLTYTLDEAIKFYMELQDPSLAENITNPEAMAYTPEMIAEVTALLNESDKRFANGQLQLYRELYAEVNKVFREVRGVDLPFNNFYSPIQAIGFAEKPGQEMTHENAADQIHAKSTMGGWALSRVRHLHPLAKQSSLMAYNDHVYAVTRYIAYEAKVRKWNSLLANPKFKATVIGLYGDQVFDGLKTVVQRITKGSHERAMMRGFDRLITKLIVAEIIGKPIAIAKQFTSMPAFANAVPAADLFKFAKEFGNSLRYGFSKEWVNSDFVRSRNMNQSQDLKAMAEYSRGGTLLNDPRIIDTLGTPVRFGDRASIMVGGDALFRYLRAKGHSVQEALDITSQTARETQSSGSIIDLSALQSSGGVARLFTAYMNQPIQFMRIEVQTLTDMASKGFLKGEGRISRTDAAKSIILFHVVLPSLFQMVVDAGWDEEKQKRAAILGSFNSIPLLANLVSKIYHRLAGEEGAEMGGGSIWDSWQRDVVKALNAFQEAGDVESYIEALELLANPAFKALWGIPTKPFFNVGRGLKTIASGDQEDFLDAFKLIAGYSPYMIEEQNRRD